MQQQNFKEIELYFDDPRLRMTIGGRLFVRAGVYIGYLVWVAAAFTFTFVVSGGLGWLHAIGVFFILVLLDRLIHSGHADRFLTELPRGGRINLAKYLSPAAYSVLEKAFDKSLLTKKDFFLEVLEQCLQIAEIKNGLMRLDVSVEEFKQKLDQISSAPKESKPTKDDLRKSVETLAVLALKQAVEASNKCIEPRDIFSAMPLVESPETKRIFNLFEVETGDLSRALILSSLQRSRMRGLPRTLGGFTFESQMNIRHRIMNRAWTARPTPTLDKYSTDLTDLARQEQVGFLIGHEAEFERLIETLARPVNPNALLVGEQGIGKESLVTHLAARLIKDDVPQVLFDKRLVALEISSLVAGAPPDELNARLKKIVEEIFVAGNIILYIPDIHNLVKTSGTAYMSAADALMPIIIHNTFPIVGATYPKEFKADIESRSDFVGAFEVIRVQEILPEEAEKILAYDSIILERQFGLTISFGAIKKAVYLAKKYFANKFLPSSAEELLKGAFVEAQHRKEKYISPDLVIDVAEAKTNVPIKEADAGESQKLLNLEEIIHGRLIDQEEAVKAVSDSLREYRSGLSRPGGPIASFLFVGPTGVGKTELAKILSKIQFGSEKSMVRFDMTEYQDKQSFYRFIGSPDGRTSGALTDAILEKPYGLILLDEFEKAFPDILNLFLQVFDDGRLTDNLGRLVDFQNTIIIATSNAHSDIINEALNSGQSMTDISEYLKKKLVDVFKPELLNRFSKIVVFKNLAPDDLGKIVLLNLKDLSSTVEDKGVEMEFDPEAVKKIVKLGYDPAFGARPLRRVIEEKVRAPLASAILGGNVKRGSKIRLVLDGEGFKFILAEEK